MARKTKSPLFRDRVRSLRRVRAGDLVSDPRNWRRHPEAQRKAMRAALDEVGFAGAIIAREDGDGRLVVIDGHLRADMDPDQKVPVLILDVDEAEAGKLLATFDPIGAMATIDLSQLDELLGSISIDSDALMTLTDNLLKIARRESEWQASVDAALSAPPLPIKAITHRGDLWWLGDHRLLCGDCASDADVDRLLDGQPIHLVNTDPPYNVKVQATAGVPGGRCNKWPSETSRKRSSKGDRGSRDRTKPKSRTLAGDFLTDDEYSRRLYVWFAQITRVLRPGRSFYVWAGWSNLENYPPAIKAAGDLLWHQLIVWVKEHPFPVRKDFMVNFELCFYGWRKGRAHRFLGPNNVTDTWVVRKVSPQAMTHLTEKPVELAARAIEYSSRRGENVLDMFAGSGSTLVACEQLDRRSFNMEIDEPYCDVILRRWAEKTGETPVRDGDGKMFHVEQLEEET